MRKLLIGLGVAVLLSASVDAVSRLAWKRGQIEIHETPTACIYLAYSVTGSVAIAVMGKSMAGC